MENYIFHSGEGTRLGWQNSVSEGQRKAASLSIGS